MAEPARIRVLAREVAEGIAAGEVIDRPAAVVKELLENSLDAGATRISVELEQGGIDRIRVVDDGGGMDAADLALALLPHATSKLRALDDLRSLETFGFRGEALASIAAAAAVDVLSRVGDAGPGMRARAAVGQPPEIAPGGAAPGTVVEVTGLFAATPARRAFLRSPRVEGQACVRVAADVALSRPGVALSVRVDGRRALSTPGRGGLEAAAAAVLGRSAATRLLPVDWSSGAMTVVGVAGEPELARADRQALVVMVNGRRVHQRSLNAAAAAPYRGLVPGGRHPVAVLDLRCDPEEVDVNVHPTKREVRFRNEGLAYEAVQRAVWQALRPAQPEGARGESQVLPGASPGAGNYRQEAIWWPLGPAPETSGGASLVRGGLGEWLEAGTWTYLGQAHRRYLIVAAPFGLGVLDQHAAHEKVLYHLRRGELEAPEPGRQAPSQGLLEPLLLELGAEAVLAQGELAADLARLGFELEAFGPGVLRCGAVPLGVRLDQLEGLLGEVLQPPDAAARAAAERHHRLAAAVACHSAVRFGDLLAREQAEALLRDLAVTPGASTCPHGRPVLLRLEHQQLLAGFSR